MGLPQIQTPYQQASCLLLSADSALVLASFMSSDLSSHSTSGAWELPAVSDLQTLLPSYDIIELIGRGGMGAVYKARQKSLKRLVAIKILPLALSDDELSFAERFKNEAFAMARLSHTGIVNVHDAGETADGLLYFVMEHVEGRDLAHEIADRAPLPQEEVRLVAMQVCEALGYLHGNGVIHRDIKPANILIDAQGRAKVADFGLARLDVPLTSGLLTRTGTSLGTADFMAPECRRAAAMVDHRADLFSLGVAIYQMLTGELPHGMFKLPSQLLPEIDERFDDIICKALEPKPEDRYQSAKEVRDDLEAIGAALPRVEKVVMLSEKKPVRAWLTIGGIAALLVVSAWVVFGMNGKSPQSSEASVTVAHPQSTLVSKLPSTLPRNQWIKLPNTQEAITRSGFKGLNVKDGWLRFKDPIEGHFDLLTLAGETGSTNVQNLALQMTVRPATNRHFPLKFEMRSRNAFLYIFNVFEDQVTLTHIAKPTPDAKTERIILKDVMFPPSKAVDGTLKIECGILGNLITFSVDGIKVLEVTDETLPGVGRFFLGSADESEGAALKDASIKLLDQGRTIDLLALVDVKRDAVLGKWSRSADGLSVAAGDQTTTGKGSFRVQLPFQPPEEYDFEIEFTAATASGLLIGQILSASSRNFSLILDGDLESQPVPLAGFEMLDGMSIRKQTETMKPLSEAIQSGRRYRSRVEVRRDSMRAFLDDKEVKSWNGSRSRLSTDEQTRLRDQLHLGLRTNRPATFHRIEVREINGTGKIDGGEAPTAVQAFKGHRYQFVAGDLDWEEAKAEAEKMGGHLATITSAEEGDWTWQAFSAQLPPQPKESTWRRGWWLGASQSAQETLWQWPGGENMTYTNWGPDEPRLAIAPPRYLWMSDDDSQARGSNWSAQLQRHRGGFLVEWDSEK